MSYEERRKELDEELKARGLNSLQRGSKTVAIMLDVLSEDKGHRFTDIYDADHELTRLSFEVDLKRARVEQIQRDIEEHEQILAELKQQVEDMRKRVRGQYVLKGEDMVLKLRKEVEDLPIRFHASFGLVSTSGYGVKTHVLHIIDRYLSRPESILDLLEEYEEDSDDGK